MTNAQLAPNFLRKCEHLLKHPLIFECSIPISVIYKPVVPESWEFDFSCIAFPSYLLFQIDSQLPEFFVWLLWITWRCNTSLRTFNFCRTFTHQSYSCVFILQYRSAGGQLVCFSLFRLKRKFKWWRHQSVLDSDYISLCLTKDDFDNEGKWTPFKMSSFKSLLCHRFRMLTCKSTWGQVYSTAQHLFGQKNKLLVPENSSVCLIGTD